MKTSFNGFMKMFCLLWVALFLSSNAYSQDKASFYWADAQRETRIREINLAPQEEAVLRLMTEIPAGLTLKAYNITVVYNQQYAAIGKATTAPNSKISVKYLNSKYPGALTFNGFDVVGITGPQKSALIDVTLSGKSQGSFDLVIAPNSFGGSYSNQFMPLAETIRVNIQ